MFAKFLILYRQFLSGYFELETTSGQLEAGLSIWNVVAMLAVPGLFASGFSLMKTGPMLTRPPADFLISALDDRIMFIVLTIVVVGLVTVLNVHKLLPTERERNTLHLLPVPSALFIGSKLAAFFSFVLLFFAVFNVISALIYPVTTAPLASDALMMLRFFTAHLLTIVAASLFTFALFTGAYGLITIAFSPAKWPRISSMFQLFSVSALVSFLFVGMLSLRQLRYAPAIAKINPALWFLGLYQVNLREPDLTLLVKKQQLALHFGDLASSAKVATLSAAVIGLALILLTLIRENRREASASQAANSPLVSYFSRRIANTLCPPGLGRAVFGFAVLTVLRVHEYQIMLAAYVGIGAGLILNEVASAGDSSSMSLSFAAPLTLSFVLVSGLTTLARIPVNLSANWVFQTSPDYQCDSANSGVRAAILACGLLPLLLVLAPVYVYLLGVMPALLFLIYCGLLGLLLLEALTWEWNFVPFTFERHVSNRNLPFWFVAYALALAAYTQILAPLAQWLSQQPMRGVVADAMLAALCFGVYRYRRQRGAERQVAFEEVDIDAVQLLNLGTR